MNFKSLFSKLVVSVGLLLLGAVFISNYSNWFGQKHLSQLADKSVGSSDSSLASSGLVAESEPEKKIIALAPSSLNLEDQKKWTTLREIMKSKNDNDPRLDKDLRDLSLSLHSELQRQYQALPMESRNERGLIAFLIARDLKDIQDLDFLKSLYQESPCMSLEDCRSASHSDPHLSGVDQTSANYPQLAALYQLEKQLNSGNKIFEDSNFKDQMRQLLANAAQFPVPMVQKKAEALRASHPF